MQRTFPAAKPSPNMKVPVELLYEIVEHVARPHLDDIPGSGSTPSDDAQALQTLFNLCLTSRLLYDITLPVLYREFALGYNDIPSDHFQPQIGQRMTAFVRTLLIRRDLAGLVKRAFLHPGLVERMGPENRKMISALAKKCLKNDLLNEQPIEILILALMPNLERLVFAGFLWAGIPLAMRAATWKLLKWSEETADYGCSFTEAEAFRQLERDIVTNGCMSIPLPDEDDDDDDL